MEGAVCNSLTLPAKGVCGRGCPSSPSRLPHLLPPTQNSQNNRTQTTRTEMTFNISCRSKIKNIQKVCGVQKSLSTEAPAWGPSPSRGKRRGVSGGAGLRMAQM